MENYKYFENVKKNGYFTDIPCQFCGSKEYCLDGVLYIYRSHFQGVTVFLFGGIVYFLSTY